MKKQILLLAGSVLLLASCSSSNTDNLNEQAKIDSAARATAALQDVINQKKNDSTINAIATAKADSIEKADAATAKHEAGTKTQHTETTTATVNKTTPPSAAAPDKSK